MFTTDPQALDRKHPIKGSIGNFYLFFKWRHLQSTFYCNGGTPPFGRIFHTYFSHKHIRNKHISRLLSSLEHCSCVSVTTQLCPILKLLNLMKAEIMDSHFLCYRCLVKLSVNNSMLPILGAVQQKTN